MTAITIDNVTTKALDGTGSFDVLMAAADLHLDREWAKDRIKGPEYATVYLGIVTQAMQMSLEFQRMKADIDLTTQLIAKAQEEIALVTAQKSLIEKQIEQGTAEIAQITAQTLGIIEQTNQTVAQTAHIADQRNQTVAQTANITEQTAQTVAQTTQLAAQTASTQAQTLNIPKEGALLDQKLINETEQLLVVTATKCKLQAEFDVLVKQLAKVDAESALLLQKTTSEQAQTQGGVIAGDSMLGRQNALYVAQTNGYARDAELKVGKAMIDSWNVRRGTDSATAANSTNKLADSNVGQAVQKMLTGIGA